VDGLLIFTANIKAGVTLKGAGVVAQKLANNKVEAYIVTQPDRRRRACAIVRQLQEAYGDPMDGYSLFFWRTGDIVTASPTTLSKGGFVRIPPYVWVETSAMLRVWLAILDAFS